MREESSEKLRWCRRCGHVIVRGSRRNWVHYSDDDWSGKYDCQCVTLLKPCSPFRGTVPPMCVLAPPERYTYGAGLYLHLLKRPVD
jgi:hypothetical protein